MLKSVYYKRTHLSPMSALPAELKAWPQWVVFKLEAQPGQSKLAKVPYQPGTGCKASTTNTGHWSDFETACQALARGRFDGLGFVFSASDPFVGIDIDGCVNPKTGALQEVVLGVDKVTGEATTVPARQVLTWLDSWSEFSCSKTGLHVILKGDIPAALKPTGSSFELYKTGRFFALTGDRVASLAPTVNERPRRVAALYRRLQELNPRPRACETYVPPSTPLRIDDAELLAIIRASKNGAQFEALWNGAVDDPSVGDYRLSCHLAFWCDRDIERMDRLFRQSPRMRAKWDRPLNGTTYGQWTLVKAIAITPCGYRGAGG